MTATILRANANALPLADESVDLIVTSPPYFALRSYQDGGAHYEGQLGSEPTPAEFLDALIAVTRECVRVLKRSGSLWVNLGDKYAGSRMDGSNDNGSSGTLYDGSGPRPKVVTTGHAGTGRRASAGQIPTKSLMGIPWRYALACIDDLGLILRAEVIWSKPNGLPESVTDRVRRSHEQWFHFVRQPRYYSAVDEIREAHIGGYSGLAATFKRDHAPRPGSPGAPDQHRATRPDVPAAHALGKLPGSVWDIPTQPLTVPAHLGVDHFAAFPMEWPRRIIRGWSPPGICTACGEGRRPVVDKALVPKQRNSRRPEAIRGHYCSQGHRLQIGYTDCRTCGESADDATYTAGGWTASYEIGGRTSATITGYACACPDTTAPTRPAVVLDSFGGTGTVALVAHALGRHGVSVDLSADYCRLARWRTTDEGEYARALQVDKPAPQVEGQTSLFELLEEGA